MKRTGFLILPFVLLFLWFRFDPFFHVHLNWLPAWSVLSFLTAVGMIRYIPGKSKIPIVLLWIAISSLELVDYVQSVSYQNFSREKFEAEIDRSADDVNHRALLLLDQCRKELLQMERALRSLSSLNRQDVLLRLEGRLPEPPFEWGVYEENGFLLAWNGQMENHENFLGEGTEDVSIIYLLHQQYLQVKRLVPLGKQKMILVVRRPFAAEYEIENRYLTAYNLLTDGLPIRPALLYNSRETTTRSADLIVRRIPVTPEISISALFEKQQYSQLLQTHIFELHWWLEMASLIFFVYMTIYLLFDFLGISGRETRARILLVAWLEILFVSALSAFTLGQFSAFGLNGFFQILDVKTSDWSRLFRSPGNFLLTGFYLLIVVFAAVLTVRRTRFGLPWKKPVWNSAALLAAFIGICFLFGSYFDFVQSTLVDRVLELKDYSLLDLDPVRLSLLFGMIWLDLGFVILVALVIAILMMQMPRTARYLALLLLLQASGSVFYYTVLSPDSRQVVIYTALLSAGLSLFVFSLPYFWRWFERINLLSRFLAVLVLLSLVSFVFHFNRIHYAEELQGQFIVNEAAEQVRNQEKWIQDVLRVSEGQLDAAIESLSIDPRITDLAYRLWTRTDLAQYGYQSALELYGEDGTLLNRFSLSLPRLAVNMVEIPTGDDWENEQRRVVFGSSGKPVLIGLRQLPGVGYLVVEATQDYDNLPFVASSSPFQELFRVERDSRLYVGSLFLNVYDAAWHPIFVSSPDLLAPIQPARELLEKSSQAWATQTLNGAVFHTFHFRLNRGYASLLVPAVPMRSHLAHLIDLSLLNLFWLSLFTLTLLLFSRQNLSLYFHSETQIRFNFFQKLMIAFIVFSMIPMASFSLLIRNYVWKKKVNEVTLQALNSFSVASKVVNDYLVTRLESSPETAGSGVLKDELLEWIAQVIQHDVSLYYDRYLLATSTREMFTAGLMGDEIPTKTYVDLFLRGQKYSITERRIGSLRFLDISGRVHSEKFQDEVVSIPFLLNEEGMEEEIRGLREYMVLVGAGLILFAVLLGYFLAARFTRPVDVLIHGTAEMSKGNLQFRIPQSYQDEFQQLVASFNAMAGSLSDQQQALEARRAYIENILNHITTAVISIDSTINVTTINPAAARLLQISPDARGPLETVIPSSAEWEAAREMILAFLKHPQELQRKEVSLLRTGNETNLRLFYLPLFQETEWNGALLLVEDISDIIRSNRLSAWAEMARRVAHEVKNPLTPIQLAMEHLVKVHEDGSEDFSNVLKSCSESILRQVKTLRRLVSDFSQYGRPAVLNRSEVDLNAFLVDLAANYEAHLPEGIRMETKLQPHLPTVRIDEEKVRGALMNIIENGLQAMNGTGWITLQANLRKDGFVEIQISDTGTGVPSDILSRMFEPYFSTKAGGTGLGLPIARKNIEDHGGNVQVESRSGQGTTVTILLPL